MITKLSQMVVYEGPSEVHGVHHTCLYHRQFPENWARGESAAMAALHLLHQFERELDSVAGASRRAGIEEAMADVREFLDSLERTGDFVPCIE